jgi:hypothetical protein
VPTPSGPSEPSATFLTVERREPLEVDAAWHHPDVAVCGSRRQCGAQSFGDDDRSLSADSGSSRRKYSEVNREPSHRPLRATAEQIASPKLNEYGPVAHGAGCKQGHYTSVRNVDERRVCSRDGLPELVRKPPVHTSASTPAVEMDDFDLHPCTAQASNLLLDEYAAGRVRRRRIHVRDDEDAQEPAALVSRFST